jgi:soluble lytic murein transglycosylase
MFRKTAHFISAIVFALSLLTVSCSAQMTEEQALTNLRQMSRDGRSPSEDYVAGIESRFAGTRTGLLAKLLRAKIKFDNKDFAAAAALLNTEEFRTKTRVADRALWLRGQALQAAGDHATAMSVFARLTSDFPESTHATDATLKWADSANKSGQAARVPELLATMDAANNPEAARLMAEAYEAQGRHDEAIKFYRRVYFFGAGTDAAKAAEVKLASFSQPLTATSASELAARGNNLLTAKDFAGAEKAFAELNSTYPMNVTPAMRLQQLKALSSLRKAPEAQSAFNAIPSSAKEKEEAYYQLTMAYARARLWPQARSTAEEMRAKFPGGKFTPKAWVDAGMSAREAKNKIEEQSFLRAAVTNFPKAVEVAGAQFELAWMAHERRDFATSSQMFTEHLARYAERDTTNRGKSGYWAARDSERAGKISEACALYQGVMYRYSANWYGYLASQRLAAMSCPANAKLSALVSDAVAALKTVTVAKEDATEKELAYAEKGEELSSVGLFEWADEELATARKTAPGSPKINLSYARYHRYRGDNTSAFLALAKSYPDYSQMFPEEMGREEWDIFYPLNNWNEIKYWASQRNLDKYQVAGLIRQESVFDPRARSHAAAYGLMQLLVPTARTMAKKYGGIQRGTGTRPAVAGESAGRDRRVRRSHTVQGDEELRTGRDPKHRPVSPVV